MREERAEAERDGQARQADAGGRAGAAARRPAPSKNERRAGASGSRREIEAAEAALKALEEELADPAAWNSPAHREVHRPPRRGQAPAQGALRALGGSVRAPERNVSFHRRAVHRTVTRCSRFAGKIASMTTKSETKTATRADLHCHSTASQVSKLGVQRALGLPECATPPEEVYALAKRRGMDFVTITDHDTIDGVLEIADRPDVFVSEELTARFRGEPQAVHVLCFGITPDDHEWLQAHAGDVEVVAELPARARDRLRARAPVLRGRGAADGRATAAGSPSSSTSGRSATAPARRELNRPAAIYVETHGGTGVGGSDDHAGVDIGRTWTETPAAATPARVPRATCAPAASSARGEQGSRRQVGARGDGARRARARPRRRRRARPTRAAVLRMVERVMAEGDARARRDRRRPRPRGRARAAARLAGRDRPRPARRASCSRCCSPTASRTPSWSAARAAATSASCAARSARVARRRGGAARRRLGARPPRELFDACVAADPLRAGAAVPRPREGASWPARDGEPLRVALSPTASARCTASRARSTRSASAACPASRSR